jgi:hypothetical protein
MKRYLSPLFFCLLALGTMLTLASPSVAQQTCVPFKATTVVTLTPLGGGVFTASGSGTGTPIGNYTQTSTITFFQQGKGAVRFRSTDIITTPVGTLSTTEMGSSTFGRAAGTFRITGGTGAYAGASGSGSFRVVVNANGTQTATYTGTLCLPARGN